MACCLVAPSIYMSNCSLLMNEVFWHLHKGNVQEMLKILVFDVTLEITY